MSKNIGICTYGQHELLTMNSLICMYRFYLRKISEMSFSCESSSIKNLLVLIFSLAKINKQGGANNSQGSFFFQKKISSLPFIWQSRVSVKVPGGLVVKEKWLIGPIKVFKFLRSLSVRLK